VTPVLWGALAFFVLVTTTTAVGIAVLALRGWRQMQEVRAGLLVQMEQLNTSLAAIERRLGGVEERTADLQESIDRLSVALAKARVLMGAAREVGDVVGRVRAVIPQK
jgi:hypothetical protein